MFGDVSNLTKLDADRGSYAAKPEDRRLMETGPSQNLSHRSFTYWRKFDPKRSLKRTWIDDSAHHRKSFEQYQSTRLPRRRRSRARAGCRAEEECEPLWRFYDRVRRRRMMPNPSRATPSSVTEPGSGISATPEKRNGSTSPVVLIPPALTSPTPANTP